MQARGTLPFGLLLEKMKFNLNTKEYWDQRFSSGDWEGKHGRLQTENFARGQIKYLKLKHDFKGTILDFGCGLGDSMPVYKEVFPQAKLIGVDISSCAIEFCRMRYNSIAAFFCGDYQIVPQVDVIIASNIFEHLSNDNEVIQNILSKCNDLYVIVPYKEYPLHSEHLNTYHENYYLGICKYEWNIFPCRGWSQYGISLLYDIYFKNVFRYILRFPIQHRRMQIMFHFKVKT